MKSLSAWYKTLFPQIVTGSQKTMARAIWNGVVLAESAAYRLTEGNVYFPLDSVKQEYLRPSDHRSVCFWKGTARYFDAVVDGKTNKNAAWLYPNPTPAAVALKDHVAFWRGVKVER